LEAILPRCASLACRPGHSADGPRECACYLERGRRVVVQGSRHAPRAVCREVENCEYVRLSREGFGGDLAEMRQLGVPPGAHGGLHTGERLLLEERPSGRSPK